MMGRGLHSISVIRGMKTDKDVGDELNIFPHLNSAAASWLMVLWLPWQCRIADFNPEFQ